MLTLFVEPDSLANLITNMNVAKCAGAKDTYLALTNYAITKLALPNVSMYLDGGHGGWLGWPGTLFFPCLITTMKSSGRIPRIPQ